MTNEGNLNLRSFAKKLASGLKGRNYEIDSAIPLGSVSSYMLRRLTWLARGGMKTFFLRWSPQLVFLGPGARLLNARGVHFGRGVTLGTGALVDGLSRDGVHLGDGVSIGPYSILRCTMGLSQIGAGIWIGRNSSMDAFAFVGAGGGVRVGENVLMGQHVSFHAENHGFERIDVPIKDQGVTRSGIIVEDDCWIGSNVTFLDGAHVGRGSVIGAGSVITGSIPPLSVAVGIPARAVRKRGSVSEGGHEGGIKANST